MLSALKDGEASQSGYIITGRAEFLEPIRSGIPLAQAKLRGVQAFGLAPKADLDRLGQLVEQKIEFLERSVRVRETEGFDAAAAVVRTGEGKARMDVLRREVAALENLYVNRLREREVAAESYARRTTAVVLLSTVLAGLLVAASVVLSGRDSARRARAERALAAEHAKLAATIASMPYGLVLFDRGGTIVLQNAAAKELLKLPVQGTSPETRRRIYRLLESDGREIPYEQWPTHQAVTGERIVGRRSSSSAPTRRRSRSSSMPLPCAARTVNCSVPSLDSRTLRINSK
jgi:CHASE3 domain sensor protein